LNNEQKGGDYENAKNDEKYQIPDYKEPVNNPMIPNEQKRIYYENKPREPQGLQPMIDFKFTPPPKPKPTSSISGNPLPNPAVFYPNYVPNPFDPIAYANYMQYTGYGMQQPLAPIYKEYNI